MEFPSLSNTSLPPLRTLNPPSFDTPRSLRAVPTPPSLVPDLNTTDSSRSFHLPPLNIMQSPNHNQQPTQTTYRQPLPLTSHTSTITVPPSVPQSLAPLGGNPLEIDPWNSDQAAGARPSSPVPDTAFVDLLATSTGMEASQRADFQFFHQQIHGMPPAHLRAFLFCYAQQIATMNRIADYNSQLDRLTTLVNQLAARLETSFELTPIQKTNIASIIKDVMVQKNRTSYGDMYLDVLAFVNPQANALGLSNLSDANKKKVTTFIKRTCSTYRNSFRREILHSIRGGKTRCSLSQFLFRIGQGDWFRNPADRDSARLRIQFAIYRRLAAENLSIISSDPSDDEECEASLSDGDDDEDHPRKRRRTNSGSVPMSRRGKKKAGSPAWWDFVAHWFAGRRKEWGLDMNNSGWSQYIQDTMAWERTNFPEPAVFEPSSTSASTSSTQGIFGALYASSSSSTPSAFTFTPPSA